MKCNLHFIRTKDTDQCRTKQLCAVISDRMTTIDIVSWDWEFSIGFG